MVKNRYVLITTKYHNTYSIYYDVNRNCFLKRKESTPKSIYLLSILFTVFMRRFTETKITHPFSLVIFIAIFVGVCLGLLFYVFDQHNKSRTLKKADNSYEKKQEYIALGKALLSNQIKLLIVGVILLFVIAVTFYFSNTTKNLFGTLILSFLLTYCFNFSAPIQKNSSFFIIMMKNNICMKEGIR